jgi:hypothetical protein
MPVKFNNLHITRPADWVSPVAAVMRQREYTPMRDGGMVHSGAGKSA